MRLAAPARTAAFAGLLSGILLTSQPALARYDFDPANLVDGFRCDPDEPVETCPQQREDAAYWDDYGDRFDRWYFALAHDPTRFFAVRPWSAWNDPVSPDVFPDQYPGGMIDIRYTIALRRYMGWTMAIDMACEEQGNTEQPSSCNVMARVSRIREFDLDDPSDQLADKEIAAELRARGHPTSPAELAEDMEIYMEWLEADLRQCRGAMTLLRKFPARQTSLWPDSLFNLLDGELRPIIRRTDEDREVTVTADGDAIAIRARSAGVNNGRKNFEHGPYFMTIREANRGDYYDWAKKLATTIEPCLKPAAVPSPWSAYRAWKGGIDK
ncbi:MAG TPA: hypothetical protein PKD99_03975 [Sphingopyxis sp.]|nr:hypothetical protein [Sphingopyxis sp.]HMQ19180.1 hypothetical protein [Sphingopyxis sp.]